MNTNVKNCEQDLDEMATALEFEVGCLKPEDVCIMRV